MMAMMMMINESISKDGHKKITSNETKKAHGCKSVRKATNDQQLSPVRWLNGYAFEWNLQVLKSSWWELKRIQI